MSYKQTFAALAAAFALAATATAGTALAQQTRSLPTMVAPQAADQTHGIAIISAIIDANGALYYGSGVVQSTYDSSTKIYTVAFNRPMTGCSLSAMPWFAGYMATGQLDMAGGNKATIELRSHDNVPSAAPFHLIAFCANTKRSAT